MRILEQDPLNIMIDYSALFTAMAETDLEPWLDQIHSQLDRELYQSNHGDLPLWEKTLQSLPDLKASYVDLDTDAVLVGDVNDCDEAARQQLKELLQVFHPWRKGPFNLFGFTIDTEWHSDWKWQRIAPYISSLKNRVVLDVGCGNGYHCWRMAGAGAKLVIGVDPGLKYLYQFQVMQHYIQNPRVHMLPFGIEDVPQLNAFDTVFSMGVFYHRRSPIDHLFDLRGCLKPGGELVLETLAIDGKDGEVLLPGERYAQMRNVWFLPTTLTLETWMKRCGFKQVRTVDVNQTSTEEQRSTDWMRFHSLKDYLDPDNPELTVEGYPAPKRAVVIAEAP